MVIQLTLPDRVTPFSERMITYLPPGCSFESITPSRHGGTYFQVSRDGQRLARIDWVVGAYGVEDMLFRPVQGITPEEAKALEYAYNNARTVFKL